LPYPPFGHTPVGPFIELQTIDSTNNYALTQIHAGLAQHGMAIFAHEQTGGKGQRGRNWASPNQGNIALSILLKPAPLGLLQQFGLSVCAAVATFHFFEKYAGEDTRIKWPNDLYWKDRKAGGILIENVVRSQALGTAKWEWAVVGIGININQAQFSPDLVNPVSLRQITGQTYDPVELARQLHGFVEYYFHLLITKGFDHTLSIYLSHFYKKEEKVRLRKDNRVFEAIIKGVTADGKLLVEHAVEEQFDLGEIQWVIG
jgi:BirA family biotin operon repressor/biotin-[acetyl-CoA-carboxylase] ligase